MSGYVWYCLKRDGVYKPCVFRDDTRFEGISAFLDFDECKAKCEFMNRMEVGKGLGFYKYPEWKKFIDDARRDISDESAWKEISEEEP